MNLKIARFFVSGIAVLFFISCLNIGAETKIDVLKNGTLASPFVDLMKAYPSSTSGEFVVYRDYTWANPTWIGFLYYDDNTYGAFVITPETATIVSVLFRVETVDGKMVLTGQNIISKIAQKDVLAVNYLMALLPDMYSWRNAARVNGKPITVQKEGSTGSSSKRSDLLPPLIIQEMNRSEFGGDIVVRYAPEVPLFNVQEMSSSQGKQVFTLVRTGRISAGDEASFFNFKETPAIKKGMVFSVPASRKTEVKTVDGIKIKLDGQWTMVADNTFFLGDTAVLIVDTIDLALLQIPQENLPLSLTRSFSLSSKTSWAVLSEFSLSGSAKCFRIENLFYDTGTGMANRDIKVCIPLSENKCTIISLSVSETAYQENREYFDSLF